MNKYEMIQLITITESSQNVTHYHIDAFMMDQASKDRIFIFEDPFKIFKTMSIVECFYEKKTNMKNHIAESFDTNMLLKFNEINASAKNYIDVEVQFKILDLKTLCQTINYDKTINKSLILTEDQTKIIQKEDASLALLRNNNEAAVYEIIKIAKQCGLKPISFYIKNDIYYMNLSINSQFLPQSLFILHYLINGVLNSYIKVPDFSSNSCNIDLKGKKRTIDITNISNFMKKYYNYL